ncbi:hypothetical protein [Catenovulum adriaticum]
MGWFFYGFKLHLIMKVVCFQ